MKIYLFFTYILFLENRFLFRPLPKVLCVRTKTLFLPWEPKFSIDWAKIQTFLVFCLCFQFLENSIFNQASSYGTQCNNRNPFFCPENHNCPLIGLKFKISQCVVFISIFQKISFLIRPHPRVLCVIIKTLFLPWEPQLSTESAKMKN